MIGGWIWWLEVCWFFNKFIIVANDFNYFYNKFIYNELESIKNRRRLQ